MCFRSELRDERALNGYAAPIPIPPPGFVQGAPGYSISSALEKHMKPNRPRSEKDRRRRDTREIARLFASQEQEVKDALQTLHQTSRMLDVEIQRANEAEARFMEAQERWKAVNTTRINAQKEVAKLQAELSQYKLRFDAAQTQISQANEIILQSEKERHAAEEAAETARNQARKYHEERLMHNAREDGRRLGREEGRKEGYEMGRRQGMEQAFEEALQQAYAQTRKEANDQIQEYLVSQNLPPMDQPEQEDEEENYDYTEAPVHDGQAEHYVDQESVLPNANVGPSTGFQPQYFQPPPPTINSAPPRRSNSFFSRFKRSNKDKDRRKYNPNVEDSRGAPDVAPIVDNIPRHSVVSPLSASQSAQVGRSTGMPSATHMPEPDMNVNPRDLRPIPIHNRSPSLQHVHVDLPPDGFVPVAGSDGRFTLPPPHEMSRTPSPPGSSAPVGSFGAAGEELNAPPPPPPKSPRIRDFGYEGGHSASAGHSPQRYQQSLSESIPSTVTSAYDLVSGPHLNGRSRTPVLSAIVEHDSRQPSPASARRQSPVISPVIPNMSSHRSRGSEDDYGHYPRRSPSNNQMIADDLRYGGPPDLGNQQNDVRFLLLSFGIILRAMLNRIMTACVFSAFKPFICLRFTSVCSRHTYTGLFETSEHGLFATKNEPNWLGWWVRLTISAECEVGDGHSKWATGSPQRRLRRELRSRDHDRASCMIYSFSSLSPSYICSRRTPFS